MSAPLLTCRAAPPPRRPPQAVRVLSWHPAGNYLATTDEAGCLRIWSARTGALVRRLATDELPGGRSSGALDLEWAPDGASLAVAPEGGARVLVVDLRK